MDNDWEVLTEKIQGFTAINELFAFVNLLLEEIPFEWLNKNENWLAIAHQLRPYGETELADLFEKANQKAFQLSMRMNRK